MHALKTGLNANKFGKFSRAAWGVDVVLNSSR